MSYVRKKNPIPDISPQVSHILWISLPSPDWSNCHNPHMQLQHLPLTAIRPNPRQPRGTFDDEQLQELAASLKAVGLLQPVVVRPAMLGYELVAGERRWRAAGHLGWETIPAVVRQTDDNEMLREALLENLQRADLNPLEEAAAYQQLLNDLGCTHDDLGNRLGKSRSAVTNSIRLLRLPPGVQRKVAAGVLSQGHARALLALPDSEAMETLAGRVISEGISVRSTEELVALGQAPDKPKPGRRAVDREVPQDAADLAAELAERLDTRVSVTVGRSKGRLIVEFADGEDLARIAALLVG